MSPVQVFGAASIRRTVGFADLIEPVATAFAESSQGLGEAPIIVFAPAGADGDVHVKAAWLPSQPVFTVKVAGWFAARVADGRSANSGYLAVHDRSTGDLVALLHDDHHLTDVRTAAAGAVATRLLARADASTLAVLGTGTQAYLQALATCSVRPVSTVLVWGRRSAAANRLRRALAARLPDVDVSVVDRAESGVRGADVVVTATSSRRPILRGDWLEPGQHVTAIGADDPTKSELDPTCFAHADLVVIDSRHETPRFAGDLRDAISAGATSTTAIGPEIGELVLGNRQGRCDEAQITVAKLIGIGVQDLVAADIALRRLHDRTAEHNPLPACAADLATIAEQDGKNAS